MEKIVHMQVIFLKDYLLKTFLPNRQNVLFYLQYILSVIRLEFYVLIAFKHWCIKIKWNDERKPVKKIRFFWKKTWFNNIAHFTQIKSEDGFGMAQCSSDWATYRFHQSTFEQIKQSVKKAKAALQDRSSFLTTSAFR